MPLPLAFLAKAFLPTVIEKVFGKKDVFVKDGKKASYVAGAKGLIRSKTAAFATGSAGIIAAIQLLPVDGDWKTWITFGSLVVQWLASLYFRAITKEKV